MSRNDVMARDWHHDYYPNEHLPDQSLDVIRAHFAKMVGTPLECGPVISQAQVDAVQARVSAYNAAQAREAAGTSLYRRPTQKLVLWRGCWAVLARTRYNKRYVPGPYVRPPAPVRPVYDFTAFLNHRQS